MAKTEDDTDIGAEVTSRLDELFSEDDELDTAPETADEKQKSRHSKDFQEKSGRKSKSAAPDSSPAIEEDTDEIDVYDSPPGNLQALVAEIDWEITSETMHSFLGEVKHLKQKYSHDPILFMFLRLLESMGKYIKAKKARAHPDAVKLVNSIFNSFEKALNNPKMSSAQKKRLLAGELKTFKDFKQKLASRKHVAYGEHRRAAPEAAEAEVAEAEVAEAEVAGSEVAWAKPEESEPAVAESADVHIEGMEPAGVEQEEAEPRGKPHAAPVEFENQEAIDYLADYIVRQVKKAIKEEFEAIKRSMKKTGD